MAKSNVTIKLTVETARGTQVDASKYYRSMTFYDADGNIVEHLISPEYMDELDAKYQKVLTDIVSQRNC